MEGERFEPPADVIQSSAGGTEVRQYRVARRFRPATGRRGADGREIGEDVDFRST